MYCMDTYQNHLEECIALAIQMDTSFEQWIACFNPNQAILFAERCEIYNRMTRKGMVDLIKHTSKTIRKNVKLESHNHCHEYYIGNEGSRVIYVVLLPCVNNKEEIAKDI